LIEVLSEQLVSRRAARLRSLYQQPDLPPSSASKPAPKSSAWRSYCILGSPFCFVMSKIFCTAVGSMSATKPYATGEIVSVQCLPVRLGESGSRSFAPSRKGGGLSRIAAKIIRPLIPQVPELVRRVHRGHSTNCHSAHAANVRYIGCDCSIRS